MYIWLIIHIYMQDTFLCACLFFWYSILYWLYFHFMISTTFEQFLLNPTFSRKFWNVRQMFLGKSVVTYHRRRYWGISAICPGLHSSGRLDPFLLGFFVGRNPEVTYGGVVFLWKLIRIYRIVGWSARNRDMPYAWNIYDSDGWTLWDLQLKQPPCTPVGCLFHV